MLHPGLQKVYNKLKKKNMKKATQLMIVTIVVAFLYTGSVSAQNAPTEAKKECTKTSSGCCKKKEEKSTSSSCKKGDKKACCKKEATAKTETDKDADKIAKKEEEEKKNEKPAQQNK